MASFQANICWKRLRKRENKNYRSVTFLPDQLEKRAKKFKIFQNMIMASFQAKISWKKLRKRENKNYPSPSFLHDAYQKIKKKQQNNSKN